MNWFQSPEKLCDTGLCTCKSHLRHFDPFGQVLIPAARDIAFSPSQEDLKTHCPVWKSLWKTTRDFASGARAILGDSREHDRRTVGEFGHQRQISAHRLHRLPERGQ